MNVETAALPQIAAPKHRSPYLAVGLAAVAGLAIFLTWRASQPQLTILMNDAGVKSLRYRNTELIGFSEFRVLEILLKDAQGNLRPADLHGSLHVDAVHNSITRSYSWGTVSAGYKIVGSRLDIDIHTHNLSQDVIESVAFEPIGLKFPQQVREYDGVVPLLSHNIGNPALVTMSFGNGTLVLADEDVQKPLLIGFPWALDKPTNTLFPLRVNTGLDRRFPDMLPYIHRPIASGGEDVYNLSLRFGPPGSSPLVLGKDVLERFAEAYPLQLKWKDRRPIGSVILATVNARWPTNPRGWFLSPTLDVTRPEGQADFKQRMLRTADTTVGILKDMNAQGMIMWDVEGEESPTATYVGDPRQFSAFAPEMADVADEFFKKFRDAGLRVGVCVRATEAVLSPDRHSASQRESANPEKLLYDKITWAKNQWGATLFYLDSNGEPARPLDPAILERVSAAIPDVLIIPEQKDVRYFASTAPYFDMREGLISVPAAVRAVYPNAFSVVNTADGPIVKRHSELLSAVKEGDILLFRSWYVDPANADLKSLYY
jgi:hypothetical protein